jgi:hypothetical protein
MQAGGQAGRGDDTGYVEVWEPAGMARRMGAWVVDMVLLMAVVVVVASAAGLTQTREINAVAEDGSTVSATVYFIPVQWSGLLLAIVSAVYSIPMWRYARATLAQLLLRLRVTALTEPDRLPWPSAAVRWVILYGWTTTVVASAVEILTWPATLVFLAWFAALAVSTWRDPDGRGWHDRVARSVVRCRQRRFSYASGGPAGQRRRQPPRG